MTTLLTMKGFNKQVQPITTAGIYHSPSLWLISLSSDWTNWITIADKNLGATTVWNGTDSIDGSSTFLGQKYRQSDITASTWFHVPTRAERDNIVSIGVSLWAWWTNKWVDMMKILRIAYLWYYLSWSWYSSNQWFFWTSDQYNARNNYYENLRENSISNNSKTGNSFWYMLIREFKDNNVQPDDSWTVLYPTN